MVRTIVQLTEQQAGALERLSKARKTSKAALVREALDALLDRDRGEHDERLRRLRGVRGIGQAEWPDFADRHDEYYGEILHEEHLRSR